MTKTAIYSSSGALSQLPGNSPGISLREGIMAPMQFYHEGLLDRDEIQGTIFNRFLSVIAQCKPC